MSINNNIFQVLAVLLLLSHPMLGMAKTTYKNSNHVAQASTISKTELMDACESFTIDDNSQFCGECIVEQMGYYALAISCIDLKDYVVHDQGVLTWKADSSWYQDITKKYFFYETSTTKKRECKNFKLKLGNSLMFKAQCRSYLPEGYAEYAEKEFNLSERFKNKPYDYTIGTK